MKIDTEARYSKEHEWLRKEGDVFVYGISDHAQDQLSDIVYVELPEVGESFEGGETIGVVESVKAAADLYLPIGGEITEVNEDLVDMPEVMNADPFGKGWLVKFRASDPSDFDQMMSPEAYEIFAGED